MSKPRPLSELGPFQLVILALSLFVLGALIAELAFDLPAEVSRVLRWIDNLVCAVFLGDFAYRFYRAESKLRFMKWGWIDFLSSIPEIEALRWGRVFRLARIIRLLRAVRSIRLLIEILFASRTRGGLSSVFIITFLVLALSASGILLAEHRAPDSPIQTAEDAVWWSITTVTTVGYGDTYPVTTAGRFIAAALMFTGVGLFGTLSGVIATFFLGDSTQKAAATAEAQQLMLARLASLEARLEASLPPLPAAPSPSPKATPSPPPPPAPPDPPPPPR